MIIKPFKLSQRSMLSFPDNNGQSSRRIIAISFDYQVFACLVINSMKHFLKYKSNSVLENGMAICE